MTKRLKSAIADQQVSAGDMLVAVEVIFEGELIGVSKLKCGWCKKSNDQVDKLISGSGVCICNQCVTLCAQVFAETTSAEPKKERLKCSFCGEMPLNPKEKVVAGNGVSICKYCLNQCVDILQDEPIGVRVIDTESDTAENVDKEPGDCSCEHVERSAKANEWSQLAENAIDDKHLLQQGKLWLRKNKADEAAGKAIAKLLEIKATASLLTTGESWLSQFPSHKSAPAVVAALLKAAPSPQIYRLAGQHLRSSADLVDLYPIIRAVIESPPHAGLYKGLEELLDRNPSDFGWHMAIMASHRHRNKKTESLLARWLQLNVGNPEMSPSSHIVFARSPDVLDAAFDWMRGGGRAAENLPRSIAYLVRAAASYHRPMLPRVLRFARAWLKANPDQEDAGLIYAAVLSAAQSRVDIGAAKQWYEHHKANKTAWFVISDILSLSYWYHTKPDEYAVKEAKLVLGDEMFRRQKPRLVGALVGACTDDESIAWAKEAYQAHNTPGLLIVLLMRAPDAETIANAEAAFDRLKNREEIEPEMVYALLNADPKNALALRRARVWTQRSPENKWSKAIKPMIWSAR